MTNLHPFSLSIRLLAGFVLWLSCLGFCLGLNATNIQAALPEPKAEPDQTTLATLKKSAASLVTNSLNAVDLRDDCQTPKNVATQAPKATVVVFLSAKCPCSASHEPTLKQLAQQYESKGFRFIGFHSNSDETLDFSAKHFSTSTLPFPIVQDEGSQWANTLGALKTPHAYVISPQGKILYEGGVDDSHQAQTAKKHFLADALEAIEQGKPAPVLQARALGCVIARKP